RVQKMMQRTARGRGRVAPPRVDRSVAAEDSLWRRTQRERRMRMTRRGRVTIATVVTGAAVALIWLLEPHEAVRAVGILQPMPDFDTSPPPAEPPAERVPEDVSAHLPVGREALTLPSAAGPGASRERLYEHIDVSRSHPELAGPLRVEYTLDRE